MSISFGFWLIIAAQMSGQTVTSPFSKGQVEVDGSHYRIWSDGNVANEGSLYFLSGTNGIDITGEDAQTRGQVFQCIWKEEGDRLTLCCNTVQDGRRPQEFVATRENKFVLITLQKKEQ